MAAPTTRLPRSLVPLPRESLPGFILRLAHRLDLAPGFVVWRCGLAGTNPIATLAPVSHLFMLEPAKLERFAQVTGVSAADAAQLTLHPLVNRYPPVAHALIPPKDPAGTPRPRYVFPPWLLAAYSLYCPRCLAGDRSPIQERHGGAWQWRWRLATSFACLEHGAFLQHLCPRCQLPTGIGGHAGGRRLMAAPTVPGVHPLCCRNYGASSRALCDQRLDQPAAHLPDNSLPTELANLQARLDFHLTAAAEPVQAFQFFANLQVLTSIILATWPSTAAQMLPQRAVGVEEHLSEQITSMARAGRDRSRNPQVSWNNLPSSPFVAAGVLAVADRLLRLPPAEFQRELGQLTSEIPARDSARWGATWKILRRDSSPDFRAQTEDVLPWFFYPRTRNLPAPSSTWTRSRLISSVLPAFVETHHGYTPQSIPQELPEQWFRIFRNDLSSPVTMKSRRLRRTVAVQLVRAATGMAAPDAIDYLGITRNCLDSWDSAAVPADIQHSGTEMREGVRRLAEHLASLSPSDRVDYWQRRRHFATWHLSSDDFREFFDRLMTGLSPFPPPLSSPRSIHEALSAIIWSRVTGSEYCLAPCFRPPFSPIERPTDAGSLEVRLARRIDKAELRSPYGSLRPLLEQHTTTLLATYPGHSQQIATGADRVQLGDSDRSPSQSQHPAPCPPIP